MEYKDFTILILCTVVLAHLALTKVRAKLKLMLRLAIGISLSFFLLMLLPFKVQAAANSITIGKVWLHAPDGYSNGMKVTFQISGRFRTDPTNPDSLTQQDIPLTLEYDRNCWASGSFGVPGAKYTCVGPFDIPNGPSFAGKTIAAGERYVVSIKEIYHRNSDGTRNDTGQAKCSGNCGPFEVSLGQSTPEVTYNWTLNPLTALKITPENTVMTRDSSATIFLSLLDPRAAYNIRIGSDSLGFFKQSVLETDREGVGVNTKCEFMRNDLNIGCSLNNLGEMVAQFTLNGIEFPEKDEDATYPIIIVVTPYSNFPGLTQAEYSANITVKSKKAAISILDFEFKPSDTVVAKTKTSIGIVIKNATPGTRYRVKISHSYPNLPLPPLEGVAQNKLLDFSFDTVLPDGLNTPIYQAAGEYPVTIYKIEGSNEILQASKPIRVTANNEVTGTGAATTVFTCDPNQKNCISSAGTSCNIVSGKTVTKIEKSTEKNQDTVYYDEDGKINPGNVGILTAVGCVPSEPKALIQGLLKVSSVAGGGIALLLMIAGTFQMITSAGDQNKLQAGREQFSNAIIGLLFIIFSVLLLRIIGVDILGII